MRSVCVYGLLPVILCNPPSLISMMERPLEDKRPIGPIATMGRDLHQDVLIVLNDTMSGVPSSLRAIANEITDNTGLSITEEDISVRINAEDNMTVVMHTGGPDVTHSDVMGAEQIVAMQTDAEIVDTIIRADG